METGTIATFVLGVIVLTIACVVEGLYLRSWRKELRDVTAENRALYWALGYDDLTRKQVAENHRPLPPPDLDRARRLYDGLQEDVYRKGLRDLAAREDGNR